MNSLGYGQNVVLQDKKGRVITQTSDKYGTVRTYLGTPYLGNFVWQSGMLLYRNQRELPVQIACNIVSDEVYCRLNDSTETVQALPDEFTIEGRRFISNQHKILTLDRASYFEVLYDGPTKLFCKWTKRFRLIDPKLYTHRIPLEDRFTGEYVLSKDLYIQKPGERSKFIIPNEYSLSLRLPDMGPELANFIASHKLTDQILVEALIQYDKRHYPSKQSQ